MLRCLVIGLVSAAAAAPAAMAGEGEGGGPVRERRCGDVAGPPNATQKVRATFTKCRAAKRIARRHFRRVSDGRCDLDERTCRVGRFTCRRRFFGNSGTRVRCTHGPQAVRFLYGV